jgi:hypothetical protein
MNSSSTVANGIGQPVRRKEDFVSLPEEAASPTTSACRSWRMP